jgi:membrane-associated phospholipid phosphatase
VLGVLAYLVRALPALQRLDRSVADWAFDHRSAFSTSALERITSLGTAQVVIVLAVVVAVFDLIRTRNRWCAPFLVVVLAGMELVTLGVKDLVGRVRPTLVPAASHLGPSFPSGHSATAAAFLRSGGARPRPAAAAAPAAAPRRDRRLGRCRRRRQPRAARPPLALRRDRRARARLGLVRALRAHLRRPDTAADRGSQHGRSCGRGDHETCGCSAC